MKINFGDIEVDFQKNLFLGIRNPEGARKAVESAFEKSLWEGKISYEHCDTGDMSSVRKFAERVQQLYPAIHVLINNGEMVKN